MKSTHKLLPVCVFLLIGASLATAQGYRAPEDEFEPAPKSIARADKKRPGMFHRPEKASAAEQLGYAATLETRQRLRAARSAYDDLVHEWHDSREAPQAQFAVARLRFAQGKYEKAFNAFQYLIDYYSGQFKYNEVLDYQLRTANQIMNDRWGDVLFLPGFEAPERALPLLSKLAENAPNWDKAAGVRLTIGMIHEELKDYEMAVSAYDAVEQYHPGSDEAERAGFRKARCLYVLSEKMPRDEKSCRTALSALASFMARYKQSERQSEAQGYIDTLKLRLEKMYYERAQFYDRMEKRPEAALIAYRDFMQKFPSSDRAPTVYTRIEALELKAKE